MDRESKMLRISVALACNCSGAWCGFGLGSFQQPRQHSHDDSSQGSDYDKKHRTGRSKSLEVRIMKAIIAFNGTRWDCDPSPWEANSVPLEGANVDIYLSTSPWAWKAPRGKDERLGLGMYPHFEVASVPEITARLKKAGYKIVQEPREYGWGTEAFVADPDGYTWALFSWQKN